MQSITKVEEIAPAVEAMRKEMTAKAFDTLRNCIDGCFQSIAKEKHQGETASEKADRRNRATAYRHAMRHLMEAEGYFSAMAKGF